MRTFLLSVSAIALVACGAPTASEAAPATPEANAAETTKGPAEAPAPELGPAGTYDLDPTHASLTWQVNHFGLSNYTARFTGISGTLEFDPEDLSASVLDITVDPASVETDFPGDFKASHPDSPFDTFDQEISESDALLQLHGLPGHYVQIHGRFCDRRQHRHRHRRPDVPRCHQAGHPRRDV
jgi:hypothetical protein